MEKIVIVAESGADITKEEAEEWGVLIVPMHVSKGEETLNDGEFETEEIFKYFEETGKLPSTSAANPYDYEMAYEAAEKINPKAQILHLCYSAVTTATWQNALIASEGKNNITHLDTKAVSAQQRSIVLETAKYIRNHPEHDLKTVIAYAKKLIETTHCAFITGGLDYLKAGGRVSNAAYMGAKLLHLTPMIEILQGKLVCTEKLHGSALLAAKKMIRHQLKKYQYRKDSLFLIDGHRLSGEFKRAVEEEVRKFGFERWEWIKTGGVIGTHSGPKSFGLGGIEA